MNAAFDPAGFVLDDAEIAFARRGGLSRSSARLVGDLLDLARLEGGGGSLRNERGAVAALFDRVVARHERESDARRDRIVTQVGTGAEFVEGDPDRLEQALQNLAANAAAYA